MRAMSLGLWLLFFATTVFGHVGMKLAVQGKQNASALETVASLLQPWGLSATIAWTLSAVIWLLIVSRQELYVANSISSLRYVLIALVCWGILQETPAAKDWVGMALITVGVILVR